MSKVTRTATAHTSHRITGLRRIVINIITTAHKATTTRTQGIKAQLNRSQITASQPTSSNQATEAIQPSALTVNAAENAMTRKLFLASALLAITAGCATGMNGATFYKKEAAIYAECIGPLSTSTTNVWTVDSTTGRSATTDAIKCYQNKVTVMAYSNGYPYAALVDSFGDYVFMLATGVDKGVIAPPTASARYKNAREQLRTIIADSDNARRSQEVAEFAAMMADVGNMVSTAISLQEASRPTQRATTTTCIPGMYKNSPATCTTN